MTGSKGKGKGNRGTLDDDGEGRLEKVPAYG